MHDFDSNEEWYFSWWLQELKDAGFIREFEAQPEPYTTGLEVKQHYYKQLKTKRKAMQSKIMPARVYTPDFKVYWTEAARNIFFRCITEEPSEGKHDLFWGTKDHKGIYSVIEVTPTFDQNSMTRLATINISFVYAMHGDIITMAKVGNQARSFFDKTFTPERFQLTDRKVSRRKLNYKPKSLTDFISLFQ